MWWTAALRAARKILRGCGGMSGAAEIAGCRMVGRLPRLQGRAMALPRALRRRRVPGTMQASSPTGVCSDAWPRPSRLAQSAKFIRRGGIYPARGPCGGAGSPGRCEHRPLQGFVVSPGSHFPGWPRALPPFVGADSISARGAFAPPQTGPIWNRPLQGLRTAPRVAAAFPMPRRAGVHAHSPSRRWAMRVRPRLYRAMANGLHSRMMAM